MRSVKFPNMLSSNKTNVWESTEYIKATTQNAKLLISTERNELIGDPYFGVLLDHLRFSQNSSVFKEVVIDMIYTQIALFIPQLSVKRSDIEIIQNKEKGKLYCKITGINQIDYQPNTYTLAMFTESELQ